MKVSNPSRMLLGVIVACHALLTSCASRPAAPASNPPGASTSAASRQAASARTGREAPARDRFMSQVERSQLRERAIELLVQATLSREPLIRANAIEGLHAAPARVEDAVRAGLVDDNPGVRFVAAYTVGRLRLGQSAAFVDPLRFDPDPRVQAAAIYALTRNGWPIDPTPLASMLHDDDPLVRGEAARILGELGNPSAVPMLKAAAVAADTRNRSRFGSASDERLLQRERVFQLQVAEALARLGDPQASDSLRAALYPASREGFESAALAAQMLGVLGDRRAVGQLVELIEQTVPGSPRPADPRQRQFLQPKEVRLAAAGALARMGYTDGMYVAEMYVDDTDLAVRAQAVMVLGEGRRRADLSLLDRALADPSSLVQVAAAAAILRALDEAPR